MKRRMIFDAGINEVIKFFNVDEQYLFERHSLKKGEIVEWDVHKHLDEWIVIIGGKCVVSIDGEANEEIGALAIVCVPRGKGHSLVAISETLEYFVLKKGG